MTEYVLLFNAVPFHDLAGEQREGVQLYAWKCAVTVVVAGIDQLDTDGGAVEVAQFIPE